MVNQALALGHQGARPIFRIRGDRRLANGEWGWLLCIGSTGWKRVYRGLSSSV